jgi:hypothetical protein
MASFKSPTPIKDEGTETSRQDALRMADELPGRGTLPITAQVKKEPQPSLKLSPRSFTGDSDYSPGRGSQLRRAGKKMAPGCQPGALVKVAMNIRLRSADLLLSCLPEQKTLAPKRGSPNSGRSDVASHQVCITSV